MKKIASLKHLRLMMSPTASLRQGDRLSGVALGVTAPTGVAGWDKKALLI